MRFVNLYVRTAVLASLILAASACQTAQHPVALMPPATAPALKPAPVPVSAGPSATDQAPAATPQEDSSAQKPASTEAAPVQTPAALDPVADLVDRAEKEYQAGLANYHAGKTGDARQNFDRALNALLSSNLDIRSDDRLEKEFERIVQGVNEIYPGGTSSEAEAGQEPQQKSEPAPIDTTNEIAPTADAGTKAQAEADLKQTRSDLPLMMTDQVAGYIAYFSGHGRGVFERAYARSGRYHDMMVSTLRQEGVPQDLIYLAQAESGFLPHAMSRVGARGIWQFMAGRGSGYGLHHNMYVDDRQDPEKSTRAAARHLKDLYNQFGDWYLAMAAYNSGPGTVQAAVKRTGYADFWELYNRNVLPRETKNYVPIILAVTIMTKNPSRYGLDSVVMEKPDDYDTVTLAYPVDLRLVADCIGATTEELQGLNPGLLRLSTPRTGSFQLHIPAGTKDQFETAIAAIPPEKRLWWRYHTVHAGETIVALARTYHTTAKQIEEANHLDDPELEPDAKLIIPVAPGKHPSDTATYARHITRYKVHRGDTVESVAENFGISAQQLRRWNGIRGGSSLSGRRVLALHLPISPSTHDAEAASSHAKTKKTETATTKPPAKKSAEIERLKTETAVVHHKVKSGETLYSIASFYKTTVAALKRDNRNVAILRPGMILTIQIAR
ncbi:MAG TPA: LysM peptidoglycan-binding domain-containing protein [Candidatus Dormibacteraeota bacterium]|nr:LysM peptidoglycan-binding domain-containing protein [Candidatus Dormibacteraeota bacterium]